MPLMADIWPYDRRQQLIKATIEQGNNAARLQDGFLDALLR
jgi:hypothetical protein